MSVCQAFNMSVYTLIYLAQPDSRSTGYLPLAHPAFASLSCPRPPLPAVRRAVRSSDDAPPNPRRRASLGDRRVRRGSPPHLPRARPRLQRRIARRRVLARRRRLRDDEALEIAVDLPGVDAGGRPRRQQRRQRPDRRRKGAAPRPGRVELPSGRARLRTLRARRPSGARLRHVARPGRPSSTASCASRSRRSPSAAAARSRFRSPIEHPIA